MTSSLYPALGGHLKRRCHMSLSLCQTGPSARTLFQPPRARLPGCHTPCPPAEEGAPYPGNPSQKEARTAGLGQPLWFPRNARLGMRLLRGLGWGNKGNPRLLSMREAAAHMRGRLWLGPGFPSSCFLLACHGLLLLLLLLFWCP